MIIDARLQININYKYFAHEETLQRYLDLPWSCAVKSVVTRGGTCPLMLVVKTCPPCFTWSSSITWV